MKRVYIAGPYTSNPEDNTIAAMRLADDLADFGLYPYVPHLSHFWHVSFNRPYQYWLTLGMQFIPSCDAVFRMDGDSPGADAEVAMAEVLGIPVFRKIPELVNYFGM